MSTLIDALLQRRSVLAKDLQAPGPNAAQTQCILQAAARVPDHGKIGPWRFIVFEGEARARFGEVLAQSFRQANPDCGDKLLAFERDRLLRAPLVIAVISAPLANHKVPEWEQQLSCGAVCQNILHAAGALGYGAQWLTEWYSYSPAVNRHLNLGENERIAGFIYIGSAPVKPDERQRAELATRVARYRG